MITIIYTTYEENPTVQFCPSGNCQACLLGADQTVLSATLNSPKPGE